MADFLAAGYADLRSYLKANWTRVVLYNAADVAQLNLAPGDARVVWSGAGNPFTLTITLHGSESDVVGRTFARVRVFAVADAAYATPLVNEALAEGAAGPLLDADSLIITHTFKVPGP